MYNVISVMMNMMEKMKGRLRKAVTFSLSPYSACLTKPLTEGHAFPLKGNL